MLSQGITNSQDLLAGVKELALDGISLSKSGFSLRNLPKIFEIINDLRVIADAAPHVMKELNDLDASEAGQLGALAYNAIREILVAYGAGGSVK